MTSDRKDLDGTIDVIAVDTWSVSRKRRRIEKPIRQGQPDDAFMNNVKHVRKQDGYIPDVYNGFLEVMKQFRSHAIDRQEVIQGVSRLFSHLRVSRLFSGRFLITDFNTFLPPGSEVEVNGRVVTISEPNRITKFCIENVKANEIIQATRPPKQFLDILARYAPDILPLYTGNPNDSGTTVRI
ncbi:Paired amphipathic helix repeat family protein [Aphelenchoides avenae]|nr:Paired amphipathic helix repeat family protein [Aphelenchus avenae]